MSAFIVPDNHINSLLTFANAHRIQFCFRHRVFDSSDLGDLQALAEILLKQNTDSVNARYREHARPHPITFQITRPLSPLAALKAAQCYAYQACETRNWTRTKAYRIIEYIKSEAVSQLPGYDTVAWRIE